jgi:hypothetical protein
MRVAAKSPFGPCLPLVIETYGSANIQLLLHTSKEAGKQGDQIQNFHPMGFIVYSEQFLLKITEVGFLKITYADNIVWLLFSTVEVMHRFYKDSGWATFWAII